MTVAYLKEMPSTPSIPSCTSGMRSVAARLLGAGTGTCPLSFVGSNGVGGRSASGSCHAGQSRALVNYDDDRGTYIIFNIADSLFIRDLNYVCSRYPLASLYKYYIPRFSLSDRIVNPISVVR